MLTPSIPGRADLLRECVESVLRCDPFPVAHLVRVETPDVFGSGHCAKQLNAMLADVRTEWVARLDDDDLYLPNHFAVQAHTLETTDADVIYTFAAEGHPTRENVNDIPPAELAALLQVQNMLPCVATVRTSAIRAVGGWYPGPYPEHGMWEDWKAWQMLSAAGSRFLCIPEDTWIYRPGDWHRLTGPKR